MTSRRVSRQRQSAVGATDVLIMLQRMIDAKEREVAMLRDLLAEINHPAPAAYHRPAPMVHSRASTFMTSTCRRCSGQGPPPKSGSSTSASARSTPSVASVRRSTPSVASSRGRSVRSLDM
ncbi:uncharacterized protein H6S33_004215 [Morchella sextelata]|uniref:uncharacterized protein n=1 Tax=Morchella sextelata TaxID=1174677 RepID=UPI001D04A3F9|nr:uncharacterized protein H6S33_004215 [Morchella sextelata]KAH0605758.1 hypothetical protein H6S33_004215 [Morchella sextelata]